MDNCVTQKQIADAAKVSVNTVSLALSGSKRISEETRNNILKLAEELNYIPNLTARTLVKKNSNLVGLLLTELKNPIFMEIAQQIERALFARGFTMILMTTENSPESESKAIDLLISHQVDGILMFPVLKYNFEKIRKIRNTRTPIVLLSSGEYETPSDAVYVNRIKGGYKATLHLAKMGHRRIGFILGGVNGKEEKQKGYLLALEEMDIPFDPDLVVSNSKPGYEQGYEVASDLVQNKKPTAIIGSTDSIALGAMKWCREQGIKVPGDIAIIGFDGIDISRYAEVPLTTVVYNAEEVAQSSTALLFRLLDHKNLMPSLAPIKMEIEPVLLIRDSCGGNKLSGYSKNGVASIRTL